jgi:hypothetical protein
MAESVITFPLKGNQPGGWPSGVKIMNWWPLAMSIFPISKNLFTPPKILVWGRITPMVSILSGNITIV